MKCNDTADSSQWERRKAVWDVVIDSDSEHEGFEKSGIHIQDADDLKNRGNVPSEHNGNMHAQSFSTGSAREALLENGHSYGQLVLHQDERDLGAVKATEPSRVCSAVDKPPIHALHSMPSSLNCTPGTDVVPDSLGRRSDIVPCSHGADTFHAEAINSEASKQLSNWRVQQLFASEAALDKSASMPNGLNGSDTTPKSIQAFRQVAVSELAAAEGGTDSSLLQSQVHMGAMPPTPWSETSSFLEALDIAEQEHYRKKEEEQQQQQQQQERCSSLPEAAQTVTNTEHPSCVTAADCNIALPLQPLHSSANYGLLPNDASFQFSRPSYPGLNLGMCKMAGEPHFNLQYNLPTPKLTSLGHQDVLVKTGAQAGASPLPVKQLEFTPEVISYRIFRGTQPSTCLSRLNDSVPIVLQQQEQQQHLAIPLHNEGQGLKPQDGAMMAHCGEFEGNAHPQHAATALSLSVPHLHAPFYQHAGSTLRAVIPAEVPLRLEDLSGEATHHPHRNASGLPPPGLSLDLTSSGPATIEKVAATRYGHVTTELEAGHLDVLLSAEDVVAASALDDDEVQELYPVKVHLANEAPPRDDSLQGGPVGRAAVNSVLQKGGVELDDDDEEEAGGDAVYPNPLTQQAAERILCSSSNSRGAGGEASQHSLVAPAVYPVQQGMVNFSEAGNDLTPLRAQIADMESHAAGIKEGTQPLSNPKPPRQLEAYLPKEICAAYQNCGMGHDLYEWQAECLCQRDVLLGKNLVYCAPTSGGKSIVSEILSLRRLFTTGKPFMLVLPFVALCAEKAAHLERLMEPVSKTVRSFYGGLHEKKVFTPNTGAIVCTIEKANALINRLLEEDSLSSLGTIVVDELHMVGDDDRGYLLELLLTKLRYATMDCQLGDPDSSPFSQEGLQIIGMSATMPNVDQVAKWLGAQLYQTSYRPIPLMQFVKVGHQLKDSSLQVVRELQVDRTWEEKDPELVAWLTQETVKEGHSVLLFCGTKLSCEKTALHIARLIERVPERRTKFAQNMSPGSSSRELLQADLKRLGQLSETLADLVGYGVAFHHSGLQNEEREIVELGFKAGAISVLCATSTLAAGVNLPARRVIFRHPYIGLPSNIIDATRYRQMSGRAGRAGVDEHGESILLAHPGNVNQLSELMKEMACPVKSCLVEGKRGMRRAMLEVFASSAVSTTHDIKRYIECTLLNATNDYDSVVAADTISSLKWLSEKGFITWEKGTSSYLTTPLGKATMASGLTPEEALHVKEDLGRARCGFVMATDLHLTFLVTPLQTLDVKINWKSFHQLYGQLSVIETRVAELVGVRMSYLISRGLGRSVAGGVEQEATARRFFVALVMHDLIQETPWHEVMEKYDLQKVVLQGLQDKASKFAAMVAAFCERLGWGDLEMLITKFQGRMFYGVKTEILALSEIPYIKGSRARLLYKAGLRTPEDVAQASVDRIFQILTEGSHGSNRGVNDAVQRKIDMSNARKIKQGASALLKERCKELQAQASNIHAVLAQSQNPASTSASSQQKAAARSQSSQHLQQHATPALPRPAQSRKSDALSEMQGLPVEVEDEINPKIHTFSKTGVNPPSHSAGYSVDKKDGVKHDPVNMLPTACQKQQQQQVQRAGTAATHVTPTFTFNARTSKESDSRCDAHPQPASSGTSADLGKQSLPNTYDTSAINVNHKSDVPAPSTVVHIPTMADRPSLVATSSAALSTSSTHLAAPYPSSTHPSIHPYPSSIQPVASSGKEDSTIYAWMKQERSNNIQIQTTCLPPLHNTCKTNDVRFTVEESVTDCLGGSMQPILLARPSSHSVLPAKVTEPLHENLIPAFGACSAMNQQVMCVHDETSKQSSTHQMSTIMHAGQQQVLSCTDRGSGLQACAVTELRLNSTTETCKKRSFRDVEEGSVLQQPSKHHGDVFKRDVGNCHLQQGIQMTVEGVTSCAGWKIHHDPLACEHEKGYDKPKPTVLQGTSPCDWPADPAVQRDGIQLHLRQQQEQTQAHHLARSGGAQHQVRGQEHTRSPDLKTNQQHTVSHTATYDPHTSNQMPPIQPAPSATSIWPPQFQPMLRINSHPLPPSTDSHKHATGHHLSKLQNMLHYNFQEPQQLHCAAQHPHQSWTSHPIHQAAASSSKHTVQGIPVQHISMWQAQQLQRLNPVKSVTTCHVLSTAPQLLGADLLTPCDQSSHKVAPHHGRGDMAPTNSTTSSARWHHSSPVVEFRGVTVVSELEVLNKLVSSIASSEHRTFAFTFSFRNGRHMQSGQQSYGPLPILKVPAPPMSTGQHYHQRPVTPLLSEAGFVDKNSVQAHSGQPTDNKVSGLSAVHPVKSMDAVEGLSICMSDGAAFYVPLLNLQDVIMLREIECLLSRTDLMKVTIDLKQQLSTLRKAKGQSCSNIWPHIKIVPPCVDVRIALWLLDPDTDTEKGISGRSGCKSFALHLSELLEKQAGRSAVHAAWPLATSGAAGHGQSNILNQHLGSRGLNRTSAASCLAENYSALTPANIDMCKRAALIRKLYEVLEPSLRQNGLVEALHKIEMPLVTVLSDIEAQGMLVDPSIFAAEVKPLRLRLCQIAEKVELAAGCPLNLNASKEVAKLLFETLALPVPPQARSSSGSTSTGQLSTREEVLLDLVEQHEVVSLILQHRKLSKLLDTIQNSLSSALLKARKAEHVGHEGSFGMKPECEDDFGPGYIIPSGGSEFPNGLASSVRAKSGSDLCRLRGSYQQTATSTGRLSMDDPNLQCIPNPVDYAIDLTSQDTPPDPEDILAGGAAKKMQSNIRKAFIAPPGFMLLSADYCQVELRLMAHFSGDEGLVNMLSECGKDPFKVLASRWRCLKLEEVTPEQRKHAKSLAYSLVYGKGVNALAIEMGTTSAEAEQLSSDFMRSIPGVQGWIKAVHSECRKDGYVKTLCNRRRPLPSIQLQGAKNSAARAKAERQSVNTICQGSGADIAKLAMIALHESLCAEGYESTAKLVLMVHDELILEVRKDVLPKVATLVKHVMERVVNLRVPLPVKISVGPCWGDMQDYTCSL